MPSPAAAQVSWRFGSKADVPLPGTALYQPGPTAPCLGAAREAPRVCNARRRRGRGCDGGVSGSGVADTDHRPAAHQPVPLARPRWCPPLPWPSFLVSTSISFAFAGLSSSIRSETTLCSLAFFDSSEASATVVRTHRSRDPGGRPRGTCVKIARAGGRAVAGCQAGSGAVSPRRDRRPCRRDRCALASGQA